jgi:hypothetical protein
MEDTMENLAFEAENFNERQRIMNSELERDKIEVV